jgi:membrane protein
MQRDELVRVGKRAAKELGRDDAAGLSAELAYRFLFAIFPFGIFVAALSAFIAQAVGIEDPTGKILGAVGDNLPPDLASGIRPQLEAVIGKTQPGLLTFGAIAALWAATGGTNALIKAMNRAYEVEEDRSLVPRYALAIGLTLLASVGLVVAFVTIVGASLLTDQVIKQLNLDGSVVSIVTLLRWPVVFVMLSVAVGVLYKLAPNIRTPFRYCVAGGALFSLGWLIATAVFGLYVANFGNYANTYGALGGVIVLMLWFYLSAFILVAAAELVAAYLKELQPGLLRQAKPVKGEAVEPTVSSVRTALAERASMAKGAVEGGATEFDKEAADKKIREPQPVAERRAMARRLAPRPKSEPEDWAFAGIVTGLGATIGVVAAWLLRPRSRD